MCIYGKGEERIIDDSDVKRSGDAQTSNVGDDRQVSGKGKRWRYFKMEEGNSLLGQEQENNADIVPGNEEQTGDTYIKRDKEKMNKVIKDDTNQDKREKGTGGEEENNRKGSKIGGIAGKGDEDNKLRLKRITQLMNWADISNDETVTAHNHDGDEDKDDKVWDTVQRKKGKKNQGNDEGYDNNEKAKKGVVTHTQTPPLNLYLKNQRLQKRKLEN